MPDKSSRVVFRGARGVSPAGTPRFWRVTREIFDAAVHQRQFRSSQYRSTSHIPVVRRTPRESDHVRGTLDESNVNDSYGHLRMNRLDNDDSVLLNSTGRQQYESDIHRHLSPKPPTSPGPSGLGRPQCEKCLDEYRNKNRLRHLPCCHAFRRKCIDVWLKRSTTCPKCRAGVQNGLDRLRLAGLQLRNNPYSVRSAAAAPVRAIRPRLDASISGTQEEIRTVNSHTSTSRTYRLRSMTAQ
uniref:RING-type domain-containing protein n=1 Tax=Trichobilharzia regenti TaxID=157069 RepID=A0AA85JE71_TRIRE|nr:unnamed protein product [Trichobilharzia regenti]